MVFSYLFQKVAEIHLHFKEDNKRQLASLYMLQQGQIEKIVITHLSFAPNVYWTGKLQFHLNKEK